MARLPAPSRPVATARLVYSSTSESRKRGSHLPRRPGRHLAAADDGRDVQLDGGDPAPGAQRRQLAAGLADVRPHHDQAVPALPGPSGRPDVRAAQRRPRAHAGQRAHERGTGAEQERRARTLGHQHPGRDRLQVGVFGGVDHGPAAVPHPGQQLADALRAAEPDVGQADAADVVPPDRAAALLRHEVTQVRCAVAERGVPRELGLAHRDQTAAHPGPVDVPGRQPPRLQERRHEQHAVIAAAGRLPAHRVQGRHLGHHVPAQGRVAPADELQARTAPPGHRNKAPCGQDIDLGRGRAPPGCGCWSGRSRSRPGRPAPPGTPPPPGRSPPERRAPPATRLGHRRARPAAGRPRPASRGWRHAGRRRRAGVPEARPAPRSRWADCRAERAPFLRVPGRKTTVFHGP